MAPYLSMEMHPAAVASGLVRDGELFAEIAANMATQDQGGVFVSAVANHIDEETVGYLLDLVFAIEKAWLGNAEPAAQERQAR